MTQLAQYLANIPVSWILAGTLSLVTALAIAGWILCDLAGFGHLYRSIRQIRQEVAQLWKRDPLENLRLLAQQASPERLGLLAAPLRQAILTDASHPACALADPSLHLEPRRLIRKTPYRSLAHPAIVLMAFLTLLGTILAINSQLAVAPAGLLPVFLTAGLATGVILLFAAVDRSRCQRATVEIEALQELLAHHFPVLTDAQLQYGILTDQRRLIDQIGQLSPALNAALSDSIQKQLVPVVRNMNQAFDQAVHHISEQQQQGIGRLAAHFARQLDLQLGEHLSGLTSSITALNDLHISAAGRAEAMLQMLDRSTGLQNDLQQAARTILSDLSASHQAVIASTAQLNEVYTEGAARLNEVYAAGASHLNQTLQEGAAQIRQMLAESNTRLEAQSAAGAGEISRLFAAAADQLQTAVQSGSDQLTSCLAAGGALLSDRFTAGSDQLTSRFTEGASQLQTAFSGTTEQFANTLHTSAMEVQTALTQGSETLSQVFTQGHRQMEDAFQRSADTLTQTLAAGSAALQESYTQSSARITGLFSEGSSQLENAFSEGSSQLQSAFGEGSGQLQSAFGQGSSQLASTFSQGSAQLEQTFSQGTSALDESFASAQDRLTATLNGATSALSETLARSSAMVEQLQAMLETNVAEARRIREEELSVETQIGGYFDQMHQQINRLQDDLQANLVDIFGKFTDLTQTTLVQSDEQYQNLIVKLTESATTLMDSLDDQVRELSFLTRDVATEIASLNKNFDQSVREFGEQLQGSTQLTFQSFDQGLAAIVAQLTDTIRLIGDAVDDLPGAVLSARAILTGPSDLADPAGQPEAGRAPLAPAAD